MKREVAEEWMNRYLDGDLSEEDADILFRHIDNNPDDADTFRIMSALSLQLEKLPDVKPRFSLVDSILPALDDIDAERRAEIASDIGIMEPQHESKDEFTERRRQRSSWRDRLPVRTIGGLVAAGVILGVSIATYEPKTLSDAGQAPTSISVEQQATEQEKGAAKSNAEQDATLQAPVTNTPESTTSPESNTQPQSNLSPETTVPDSGSGTLDQQTTPPDKATPDTGTGTSQESTPSSGNKGGNPPASSQTGPESSPPSSGSDTSSNQDQSMKQQQIAPDTESSGTSESSSATGTDSGTTDSSSSNSSKSADSTTPSTANNDESSSTVAPKSNADDSSSSKDSASSTTPGTTDSDVAPKTYSIAPDTDAKSKDDSKLRSFSTNTIQQEQEWVSPTSQFAVVLTPSNTLRLDSLSKNNINGRTVVATATIDGTWLNGQWTKDGKAFNYQVAKEGKTKWYKLSTAGLQ